MRARDVLSNIMIGALDSDLDKIIDAAHARQKAVARDTAAAVKPGDRVRLTGIRPKGLDGATGTVQSRRQTSLMVVVDKEYAGLAGRFAPSIHAGVALCVPAVCIGEILGG